MADNYNGPSSQVYAYQLEQMRDSLRRDLKEPMADLTAAVRELKVALDGFKSKMK